MLASSQQALVADPSWSTLPSPPGTSVQNCPLGTHHCREPNLQAQGCVCVGVPCQEPRRAPAEGADSTGLRWGRGFSDSCSSTCGTHQVLTGPLRAGAFSQGISGTERPSNWPQVTPEGCERTGFSAPSIWLHSRSREWRRCGGSWSKSGGGRAAFSCSHRSGGTLGVVTGPPRTSLCAPRGGSGIVWVLVLGGVDTTRVHQGGGPGNPRLPARTQFVSSN